MILPFSKELQETANNFSNGNFGLWFYKLVPLDDRNDFKACTLNAGNKNVALFYRETYDRVKKSGELKKLLEKKHGDQEKFCRIHEENEAKVVRISAELQSPLITGIGKTHPSEVGMTFDHTMGIPYLPATGIKGLARLAHILNLIDDKDKANILIYGDELDDTHPASLISDIFGGDLNNGIELEKWCGKVVFLDAYPEKIPDLHVDIMNPHYGKYYGDDLNQTPPADYLDPVPVQFLTVARGTTFVFRAIVQGNDDLKEPVIDAFYKALTDQGFGAKTAVGYGRFLPFNVPDEEIKPLVGYIGKRPAAAPEKLQTETWENVFLTYNPGNQEITATCGGRKATASGKQLVPECLQPELFNKKKKSATAKSVEVEKCGNAFKIVKIYDEY